MHIAWKALAALVGGIALGLAFTWLILMRDSSLGDMTDGAWHTSPYIGTTKGGIYMRAAVALHGLFALNKSETLYYTTTTDAEGKLVGDVTPGIDVHSVSPVPGGVGTVTTAVLLRNVALAANGLFAIS